jgi:hypothetical protein
MDERVFTLRDLVDYTIWHESNDICVTDFSDNYVSLEHFENLNMNQIYEVISNRSDEELDYDDDDWSNIILDYQFDIELDEVDDDEYEEDEIRHGIFYGHIYLDPVVVEMYKKLHYEEKKN